MKYILWFREMKKDDFGLVGGKSYNLGIMAQMKLPVPPGFNVTTKAFDEFVKVTKIEGKIKKMIEECDVENTQKLIETSNKIKKLIVSQKMPAKMKTEIIQSYGKLPGKTNTQVAVRSSGTAEDLPGLSFAGQHATFLNVIGTDNLVEAVKKCWASLYEPRAIFYRAKNRIFNISICVIIQQMVNAEKSGVMFTINPTTDEDQIIIEACWGLGELLVQGKVEPDRYTVSKKGKIADKKIGRKHIRMIRNAAGKNIEAAVPRKMVESQVLTDKEILLLAKYGVVLEKHYGKAQDVEFAVEKNRMYIVQTRAVTTKAKMEKKEVRGKQILKGLASSPGIATGVVKIVKTLKDLTKVRHGDILVTKMTSPDMVVTMSRSAAIVTDEGGVTCHASIVGREMGLPVIVGTQTATKVLKDGQTVTVDAYKGFVYEGKVHVGKAADEFFSGKTKTKIKVNLVFAANAEKVAKFTDGVGLLRIEHMITQSGMHPAKLVREGHSKQYTKILVDGIKPIAKAFGKKRVWVRTLDARSDEFRNLSGGKEEPHEDNPMLGWHGIRRSLDEPELLKAEFEAVKQLHKEGCKNVDVMLPFVINVQEVKKSKEIAKEVGLPKAARIGIMVETPAAAFDIEAFCKEGIAFVSFGSNDLSQLTLGVDRNNAKLASLFTEKHPAVLKMFKEVIQICKKYGVETSICGEAPSNYPDIVEYLVKCGIDSLSVNIDAIAKVRKQVAKIERDVSIKRKK
jgi:pyruvate,water dikinase